MVIWDQNKLFYVILKNQTSKNQKFVIACLLFIKTEKKTEFLKLNYTSFMLNNFFDGMNIKKVIPISKMLPPWGGYF